MNSGNSSEDIFKTALDMTSRSDEMDMFCAALKNLKSNDFDANEAISSTPLDEIKDVAKTVSRKNLNTIEEGVVELRSLEVNKEPHPTANPVDGNFRKPDELPKRSRPRTRSFGMYNIKHCKEEGDESKLTRKAKDVAEATKFDGFLEPMPMRTRARTYSFGKRKLVEEIGDEVGVCEKQDRPEFVALLKKKCKNIFKMRKTKARNTLRL